MVSHISFPNSFFLVHTRIDKVNIRNSHISERAGVRTPIMTFMPCNFGEFLPVELGLMGLSFPNSKLLNSFLKN
jgi:hypothetical protein